jgi:hypothetical protein
MCGHSPERDASLIPVYSVFIGLAVVAVMLRLVARVLTQAYFWWDDFANLFGFVCNSSAMPSAFTDRVQDRLRALHCHEPQRYPSILHPEARDQT